MDRVVRDMTLTNETIAQTTSAEKIYTCQSRNTLNFEDHMIKSKVIQSDVKNDISVKIGKVSI